MFGHFNGGIRFDGDNQEGTYVGDFAGWTKERVSAFLTKWLYIDKMEAYSSDRTDLGHKCSYLIMPAGWYRYFDASTQTIWLADYRVNARYKRAYPEPFKETCLAVYRATEIDGHLFSIAGYIPKADINQSSIVSELTYHYIPDYSTGGTKLRRTEYQDYRTRGLYEDLCCFCSKIWNFQNLYYGIVAYNWSSDVGIVDERSRYTGVTEESESVGALDEGEVNSGEITGTSTASSLAVGTRPFKLLGVENPYGFAWENLYGIVHKSGEVYAYDGTSDSLTASDLTPSDTNIVYKDTGVVLAHEGWQTTQASANGMLVPTAVGGSSSIYNGDYNWYADGWRVFFSGGARGDTTQAGLFCLDGNAGWGTPASYMGVRLSFQR